MPPADLAALTTAITAGFASVTAAISAGQAVDLAPLVEQVERVADALYAPAGFNPNAVPETGKSVAQIAVEANSQVKDVIGTYSDGSRVKMFSETPAP